MKDKKYILCGFIAFGAGVNFGLWLSSYCAGATLFLVLLLLITLVDLFIKE